MKQKDSFYPNIGASSILMIFVVLCLTTFGILSLVTANADKKISTKNAETVESYYSASVQVQSDLQKADAALLTARADAQKAVQNPLSLASMSDSVYTEDAQSCGKIESLLKSGEPQSKKLAETYRYFARCRVARDRNMTVSEEESGLTVVFLEKADSDRSIQVRLSVLPYDSAQRYKILEEKTLSPQNEEQGDGTLQLWQGDSAAAG